MASRLTFLSILIGLLPICGTNELCDAGDVACATRATNVLLQRGARQQVGYVAGERSEEAEEGSEEKAKTRTLDLDASLASKNRPSPSPPPPPAPTTTTTTTTTLFLNPCKSHDDFLPTARMEGVSKKCKLSDYHKNTNKNSCESIGPGCWFRESLDGSSCVCSNEQACGWAGGVWEHDFCDDYMRSFVASADPVEVAAAVLYGQCSSGVAYQVAVAARHCCTSWPQRLCEPDAPVVSPCEDPTQFLPSKHWTDGLEEGSCEQASITWTDAYLALENATKTGSCDGISLNGQSLEDWVAKRASCCASDPATICTPAPVTPCTTLDDFMADKIYSAHCHFLHSPGPNDCGAHGCYYHEEYAHCECSQNASCVALGGTWHSQTCGKEVSEWDHRRRSALEEAQTAGNCADLTYTGDLKAEIEGFSKMCCKSFPATVCEPRAQRMTYCKDEADFLPKNFMEGSKTCQEELSEMSSEWHLALKKASEQSSCTTDFFHGQALDQMISAPSKKCCASSPANACHKDLQQMTPCKDDADFLPNNSMGWTACKFSHDVVASCEALHGFYWAETGLCYIGQDQTQKANCVANGGSLYEHTCGDEIASWEPQYHFLVHLAKETDCDNVQVHGQGMKDALNYPAKMCCASFPGSLCSPLAKKMTPCKDDADFQPDRPFAEWCEFHGHTPQTDACHAHGCSTHGGGCDCHAKANCEAAGGTWKVETCGMEIQNWEPAFHMALQEADSLGSCTAHSYVDLPSLIQHPAEKCCASYPATLCDKTARKMMPCAHPWHFQADKVMWSWCHIEGPVNATLCNAQADCYGDHDWCHCEAQASCEAMGGTWNAQTCAKEVEQWRPEQHRLLQNIEDEGSSCEGKEVDGMRAQDFTTWPARMCCTSWPQSICERDVVAMTPCLRREDFHADAVSSAWCHALFPVPAKADCEAQGCTSNENGDWCHCEAEAGCVALGGQWMTASCQEELKWQEVSWHKAVSQAIDKGTCDDVMANEHHQRLEDTLSLAPKCCEHGLSVCSVLTLKAGVPCASEADFTADKVLSSECQQHGYLDQGDCESPGCVYSQDGKCTCPDAATCAAAGFTWKAETCSTLTGSWDLRLMKAFEEAAKEGSCADLEYGSYESLKMSTDWAARQCCSSWPKSFCEPTAKFASICKDDADYRPDNEISGHCEGDNTPYKDERGCVAAGYKWRSRTCHEELSSQSVEWHKAVVEATESGTCSSHIFLGTPIEDLIAEPSRKCCASAPANACYKDLQKQTPCQDAGDFLGDKVTAGFCDFPDYHFDSSGAAERGCKAVDSGCDQDSGRCVCIPTPEAKAGCELAGAIWRESTCASENDANDFRWHILVQHARQAGCDFELHMEPFSEHMSHASQRCCASYPASVCNPVVKPMTPCKDEADFLPAKSVFGHCELSSQVEAGICEANLGCALQGNNCVCSFRESCVAVGGTWKVTTCEMQMQSFEPEMHKALQEANATGVCTGWTMDGPLQDLVTHLGEKCCASFPATVCDKTAKKSKSDLLKPGTSVGLAAVNANRFLRVKPVYGDEEVGIGWWIHWNDFVFPRNWVHEVFTVVDAGNGNIAFHQANVNRFLRLEADKIITSSPMAAYELPSDSPGEVFQVVHTGDGELIAFYNPHFHRFIDMKGGNVLSVSDVQTVEDGMGPQVARGIKFNVVEVPFLLTPGKVYAFHCKRLNRFLSMTESGADLVRSEAKSEQELPGNWTQERFAVIDAGNGTVYLQNVKTNTFLMMQGGDVLGSHPAAVGDLPPQTELAAVRFAVIAFENQGIGLYNVPSNRFVQMTDHVVDGFESSPQDVHNQWSISFTIVEA